MDWTAFLQKEYMGNSTATWGLAALAFFGTWLALLVIRVVVSRRLVRLAQDSPRLHFLSLLGNMLGRTNGLLLVLIGALVASKILAINDRAAGMIDSIVIVGLLIQSGLWILTGIDYWTREYRRQNLEKDPTRVTIVQALSLLVKIVVMAIIVLMAIQNAGIQVTGLIASIGIVGVGAGVALQNGLADVFASLSIVMDRPFVLGDFIIVGDKMGVVEDIGLKTTRLRSLGGEEIVFGNQDLLSSRIQNFKKMRERRIAFAFEVVYQTSYEHLQAIPQMLRSIIEGIDPLKVEAWCKMAELKGEAPQPAAVTRFDRAHFSAFQDSGLKFDIVYYVASPEYNLYMDIQQMINLEIVRQFREAGIDFAYPTRTLFIAENAGPIPNLQK